jgi:hypothetical protein
VIAAFLYITALLCPSSSVNIHHSRPGTWHPGGVRHAFWIHTEGVWAGFSLQKEHLGVWTFRALGETFEFPWFYQSYHHPWWIGDFAWICHIRLRWIAAWSPMPPGRTRKRGWMLRRRHQLGGWIRCVMIWYDMIWCTSNIHKYSQNTMTISTGKWRLIDLLSTLGYYIFGQTHISLPKIAPCLAKFRRRLQKCDSCVIQAPYFQRNLGSRLSTHGSTVVGVGAQVLNPSIPQEIN